MGTVTRRLQAGDAVPENCVAISFDDAYDSVYTEVYSAKGVDYMRIIQSMIDDNDLTAFDGTALVLR